MQNLIKVLLLQAMPLFTLLTNSLYGHDLYEFLEPTEVRGKLQKEIASLDLKTKVKLFDLSVIDGITLSASYQYESNPSYFKGFYSRVDKWNFSTSVSPLDLVGAEQVPFGLNVSQGAELVFVRHFQEQWDSVKALPKTPLDIPLTAERLEKLDPGTFVSIPTSLNLSISASANYSQGVFNASGSVYYLISGEFTLQVFRMQDQRARIRLIARKAKTRGVDGSLSAGPSLEVFQMSILNKQINRFIKTDLVSAGFSKTSGDLFVIEYQLDFKHQEVREAYDRILKTTFKFKNFQILNPFTSTRRAQDILISDLSVMDEMAKADLEKPIEERRVDRVFKAQNKYTRSEGHLKLGLNRLAKINSETSFTDNFISYFDREDRPEYYLFYNTEDSHEESFLFSLFKEKSFTNFYMLTRANENGQPQGNFFSDVGRTYEYTDKAFHGDEQKHVKATLERLLPKTVFDEIKWQSLILGQAQYNSRVFYEILFHKDVLKDWQEISKAEYNEMIVRFIVEKKLNVRSLVGLRPDPHLEEFRRLQLKMINDLFTAFSKDSVASNQDRMYAFKRLTKNELFQKIGTGVLISLLPTDKLRSKLFFKLNWTSDQVVGQNFVFGQNPSSELYTLLQQIQSILNGRNFDLRLVGYEIGGNPEIKL